MIPIRTLFTLYCFCLCGSCLAFPLPISSSVASSPSVASSSDPVSDRRSWIVSTIIAAPLSLSLSLSLPLPCRASDVRAPIELLVPATRVRLYIDETVEACEAAILDKTQLDRLLNLLLMQQQQEAQAFMTPDETTLSKRYLEINTSNAWNKARLSEREARGAAMGVDYTTPYDRFNTAVQSWGDKRQFQILRKRQRSLEKANKMRAAFNAYTNNLVFGDNYQLNAAGEEKKRLIRSDALPNVNAVVVSDLDLRDLYRNQVLQNMEDAKAELEYQLKQQDEGMMDMGEVLVFLREAKLACQEWFRFIPEDDVKSALRLLAVMESKG